MAPSAVKLMNLPESAFAPPRALEAAEIDDVVRRFVRAAVVAQETGFTGVQIHAAHGYLISQFLTPLVNQRTDQWGGSLENRARLLLTIVREIRKAVGPAFPISAKRWLEEASLDLLEISGGNYEEPSMMGSKTSEGAAVAESTVRREAYFMEYAEQIRKVSKMPLMVTGGFRSKAGMEAALASGALDVIGLGRPMCVETDLPAKILAGESDGGTAWERNIKPAKAGLAWFRLALIAHGDGSKPDIGLTGPEAIERYLKNEEDTAVRLRDRAA